MKKASVLDELRNAGMTNVFVGLESANDDELCALKKDVLNQTNRALIRILRKHRICLMSGFIMFTERTSLQGLKNNLDFLYWGDQLYRSTPLCRTALLFPGTQMYQEKRAAEQFDLERSTPFVLYPIFSDTRIKNLSAGMEVVEKYFSTVDQIFLRNRTVLYEEFIYGERPINRHVQQAVQTLQEVSYRFYESFLKLISRTVEEMSPDEIAATFISKLPSFESLASKLEEFMTGALQTNA